MIRGKNLSLKSNPIDLDINAKIHNRFDIEVIDSGSGKVKQQAVGYNVICDNLWSKLLSTNWGYFNYIHYGDGSGTPSPSDTSLFSFIGYKAIETSTSDASPIVKPIIKIDYEAGVYSITNGATLGTGDAVGKTITEVGIAYSSSANTLCTHSMLQDMNGNPVSITKTDTDVIHIYATMFVKYDSTGAKGVHISPPSELPRGGYYSKYWTDGMFGWLTGSVTSNYTYLRKYPGFSILQTNGICLKEFSTASSSKYSGIGSVLTPTFDVENRKLTLVASRVSPESNNFSGGYRYMGLYSTGNKTSNYMFTAEATVFSDIFLEVGEGNVLQPSEIVGEAIGTGDGETVDFKTSFIKPYDCTIFVDGIPVSDVTVDCKNHVLAYDKYIAGEFVIIRPESTPDNIIWYNNPHNCSCLESLTQNSYGLTIFECTLAFGSTDPMVMYLYNLDYQEGIGKFQMSSGYLSTTITVYFSDDMENWVEVPANSDVPTEHQHDRFLKIVSTYGPSSGNAPYIYNMERPSTFSPYNIHFNTPPANGAVITANYKTPVIAKDENHVYDLTVTIQLGEYTE